jgi:hypothetical protein
MCLVSQQARLSIRQVLSMSAERVGLVRPGVKKGKKRLRVGDAGFAVDGRVVWHGRSLSLPARAQTPASPLVHHPGRHNRVEVL